MWLRRLAAVLFTWNQSWPDKGSLRHRFYSKPISVAIAPSLPKRNRTAKEMRLLKNHVVHCGSDHLTSKVTDDQRSEHLNESDYRDQSGSSGMVRRLC